MTQKTTDEIRVLLSNAKLDFESVENRALNDYLPKIFCSCPFTEDICTTKQCLDCQSSINHANKQSLTAKTKRDKTRKVLFKQDEYGKR